MSNWRITVALVFCLLQASFVVSQSASPSEKQPVPVSPALYAKWRKYGQWDYKQQGFKYRDAILFNFGATGSAAGLDRKTLLAIAQASKPSREDVKSLDDAGLEANFILRTDLLDKLRKMAEEDAHLIRIARDFTWLDTSSKWPRENIGFSDARWNEYRSLFKTLSLDPEGGFRRGDTQELW
jgi:hypothetical protein